MNIKQLARLTGELGDPVSEGTVHNVLKGRVSHARYATIRPLCAALGLDYNTVLAEISRPLLRPRTLPEDFQHLTDDQWRALLEVAKQLRIANESRQRPADSSGRCATGRVRTAHSSGTDRAVGSGSASRASRRRSRRSAQAARSSVDIASSPGWSGLSIRTTAAGVSPTIRVGHLADHPLRATSCWWPGRHWCSRDTCSVPPKLNRRDDDTFTHRRDPHRIAKEQRAPDRQQRADPAQRRPDPEQDQGGQRKAADERIAFAMNRRNCARMELPIDIEVSLPIRLDPNRDLPR